MDNDERRRVRNAFLHDKPAFLQLAKLIQKDAPDRQWNGIIVDACHGYWVGELAIAAVQKKNHQQVPRLHIAHSRGFRATVHHKRAVMARLLMAAKRESMHRVLVVTEYVEKGKGLRLLAQHCEWAGMQTDLAVLSSDLGESGLAGLLLRERPDSRLYVGGGRFEPGIYTPLMRETTGLRASSGKAEAQPNPAARPDLIAYAQKEFANIVLRHM